MSTRAALADALLRPASVALYGASDDPGRPAGRPLAFLRAAGFQGRVYPVHPTRTEVQGARAWSALAALPEVPEHVFIVAAAERVEQAVRECVQRGVRVATILADGFSEQGPEGAQREHALRDMARAGGLRLLGPSSIGVANPRNGLLLTANAAFAEQRLPVGRLFCASHSGSMIGALLSRGVARGVGFAGLVSVGSEADLSLGEICEATLDDEGVDSYVLFLESLRHAADLQRFALQAAQRGRPIIAYKLGRSRVAARMAATHTGAIAGEDDIADAFLRGCGIARVGVLDALLEAPCLARRVAIPVGGQARPVRVGVVTTTGGGAATVVDQLGVRGLTVQAPSEETVARIREAGVRLRSGEVLDLTLAGTRYEVMKPVLDAMLQAPEFDLVLATVGSSARFQPELAVAPLLDARGGSAKPLAVLLVPDAPEALASLTAADVPCFRAPEACADAIAAVFGRRSPRARPAGRRAERARAWSEFDSYGLLARLGIPHAPVVRLPLDAPAAPQLPFAYPVAVKASSADLAHKSDVGGVLLGIEGPEALVRALGRLRASLAQAAPHARCDEALVQPMAQGLGEVLLGFRVDPEAGPIVLLAAGGIWAEIANQRSIRLAPVSIDDARSMVAELPMMRAMTGVRGRRAADLEGLARALVALSSLADGQHGVQDAEINPLLLREDGVLAVDALVFAG
ncbi:acetate--CoA ligase family protein [Ramlibacter sp. AN1015]|uniref:acetate--CoA ligase family protein n=1 Tax=Ramlibacter sp. AN1015 TaxID=3133428 RepID=UPI0030C08E94